MDHAFNSLMMIYDTQHNATTSITKRYGYTSFGMYSGNVAAIEELNCILKYHIWKTLKKRRSLTLTH